MTLDFRADPVLMGVDQVLAAVRELSPDPFADDIREARTLDWWYAPGQYELALLDRVVKRGRAANRFAHYAGNYGQPDRSAVFWTLIEGSDGRDAVTVAATGNVSATLDGVVVAPSRSAEAFTIALGAARSLELTVIADPGQPAAFAILQGAERLPGPWFRNHEGERSTVATSRPGTDVPAHELDEPVVPVDLEEVGGLLVAPAEILARISLRSEGAARIRSGESRAEALDEHGDTIETSHTLVDTGTGELRTEHALGFRFLAVSPEANDVSAHAHVRAVDRRGGFTCSDALLNRIWATGAYTVRLCMQSLLIDGIKRDRMPWIGDQAVSAVADAYAFGDATIAHDSHLALGFPTEGYVNGIADYSLWWLICADTLQTYFPTPERAEWLAAHVDLFLERLAEDCDESDLFCPRSTATGFTTPNAGSILIDWGYVIPNGDVSTALQMLWAWALRSAVAVLERAAHPAAAKWAAVRVRLIETLQHRAWSGRDQRWRLALDNDGSDDHYANFLSVLADVAAPVADHQVIEAFASSRGRTPFMTSFVLDAIARSGRADLAIGALREQWGSMLEHDGTTFWEEFTGEGTEVEMYGRAFGKSLCHAWASGPASLLPQIVLGLRPRADGWSRFEVRPQLGDLDWASATVPTPHGPITVSATPDEVMVDIPAGCVLLDQMHEVTGPARHVMLCLVAREGRTNR